MSLLFVRTPRIPVRCICDSHTNSTSNSDVREILLAMQASETDAGTAIKLASVVAELSLSTEDVRHSRAVILALLARVAGNMATWAATQLVHQVVKLTATAEDKRGVLDVLLGLLMRRGNRFIAA